MERDRTLRDPIRSPVVPAFDVAERLGVDVATLARWHGRGRGPSLAQHEPEMVYELDDVEAWLDRFGGGDDLCLLASTEGSRN